MAYRALLERLDDRDAAGGDGTRFEFDLDGPVVAFPDGSVDVYYRLFEGRDTPIESRAALGEWIADAASSSLRVEPQSREAGGQAVNTARQAAALGAPVRLYGHVDDPAFDGLPFPARSMGDPATVAVYALADEDLMISEHSADLASWSSADLFAVPGARATLESASALAVVNWLSVPGVEAALRDLATLDVADATVLFDAGDVTGCDRSSLGDLLAALGRLAGTADVVLSANAAETEAFAAAAGATGDRTASRLAGLCERVGLAAAVCHGRERAVVGHPNGEAAVPTLESPRVRRRTGAGDRFNGALACARADGWDWAPALALGNACASRYVATAGTADAASLVGFLRDVPLPGSA